MTDGDTAADLEGEQEVDLRSAWGRLKERWWLPVGGLVLGAVVGIALALAGGSVWRAETILYLGQPFAPLGGGQIQSLATNPRTVGDIVRSESALQAASRASGVPVSKLRSAVSTKELTAVGQARGINPLMELAVKADGKEETGSQSYVPPDPKNDKALHAALELLRGTKQHSAFPPNPKAVPN